MFLFSYCYSVKKRLTFVMFYEDQLVHLLVYLVVYLETSMLCVQAVKNFILGKTGWVSVVWLVLKIAFFIFLTQHGPTTLAPKEGQTWNSLNRILIFNALERQKLYIIFPVSLLFHNIGPNLLFGPNFAPKKDPHTQHMHHGYHLIFC